MNPKLEQIVNEPEPTVTVEVKAIMKHSPNGQIEITIGAAIITGQRIEPVKTVEEAAMMLAQALFQYQHCIVQQRAAKEAPLILKANGPLPTHH